MKWVLKDYLRRWWWVLGGTVCGQMALMEPSIKAQRMAPLLSLFVGVIPLLIDLSRGYMRTLSLLPIRRQEIATKFWLISVAVPAALTIGVSFAGQTGFAYFQQKTLLNPGWWPCTGSLPSCFAERCLLRLLADRRPLLKKQPRSAPASIFWPCFFPSEVCCT